MIQETHNANRLLDSNQQMRPLHDVNELPSTPHMSASQYERRKDKFNRIISNKEAQAPY